MAPHEDKQKKEQKVACERNRQASCSSQAPPSYEESSPLDRRMQPRSNNRQSTNTGPNAPSYDYVEYFDGVDKMMQEARDAKAAAKLPASPEQPPPPDYETIEYFAKMDAMMAKIKDGTIDDDEDEPDEKTHRASKAIGAAVNGAAKFVKRFRRSYEPASTKD